MRASAVPALFVVCCLAASPLAAQGPAKAKDLPKLEAAAAAAAEAEAAAASAARRRYDEFEAAVQAARAGGGDVLVAELARVLEPVAAAFIKEAAPKKGAARTAAAAAVVKRDGAAALAKLEHPVLAAASGYFAARLTAFAAESDFSPAALEAKGVATALLAEWLGKAPFHELWNDRLAAILPEAEAFRKAHAAAKDAQWDVETAKDPVQAFRRGAPEGFARVPAGAYVRNSTLGKGALNPKARQSINLPADVFVGLYEVTNAEYYAWWKTLDAASKATHLPNQGDQAKTPLWPIPEGGAEPAPTEAQEKKPVTGVRFASAVAYAASRGARLPTEGEWCAAAGGREGLRYPWGAEWKPLCANDAEAKLAGLSDVGSFPTGRGPFGHFDLAGNADEWTSTYETGKDVDFAKLDASLNAAVRGGSYTCSKDDVSNFWQWQRGIAFDASAVTGFRLAMDVAPRRK
jgi:formylglycine-generating enzyme required for sulfatase activity